MLKIFIQHVSTSEISNKLSLEINGSIKQIIEKREIVQNILEISNFLDLFSKSCFIKL